MTENKPSPFDSIKVPDPNSVFGRIVSRLRGYHPTQTELESFQGAVRTIVYSTVGAMTIAGYAANRYASSRRWTPFQRLITSASGSMVGFWAGSAISSTMVSKTVLSMEDSYIAKVVKEEVAISKGLIVRDSSNSAANAEQAVGELVWKATNSTSTEREALPKSISPVARVGAVADGVKQFEEYEKELWDLSPQTAATKPAPSGLSGNQRKYNQYGDVIE
ncbi:hypothetical protein BDR26DRAFT_862858 [Obelidium mucronatum]|nr:hypothetical protein BDR26DRAFT_862858 [Obelidium mucronatum]